MAFNPKGGIKQVSADEAKAIIESAIKTRPVEAVANQPVKVEIEGDIPTFEAMTKTEIETWAIEKLGIDLDRRLTKRHMIDEIKKYL